MKQRRFSDHPHIKKKECQKLRHSFLYVIRLLGLFSYGCHSCGQSGDRHSVG